jgi:hypothetical protein
MSALAEQHERWAGARERLGVRDAVPVIRGTIPEREVEDECLPIPDADFSDEPPRWKRLFLRAIEEHPIGCPFNFMKRPSPHAIIKLVALKYDVPARDIIGPSLLHRHSLPRQHAILLIHTHCELSSSKIGKLFTRDHTTVLYSIRQAQKRLAKGGGW